MRSEVRDGAPLAKSRLQVGDPIEIHLYGDEWRLSTVTNVGQDRFKAKAVERVAPTTEYEYYFAEENTTWRKPQPSFPIGAVIGLSCWILAIVAISLKWIGVFPVLGLSFLICNLGAIRHDRGCYRLRKKDPCIWCGKKSKGTTGK